MLAVTVGRALLVVAYRRAAPPPGEADRWNRRYVAGAGLQGLGWGAASVLLFPLDSLAHQVFLLFVLAGMASGGLAVLTARLEAFLAYLLPTLLPATARLLVMGDEMHLAMGLMAALYTGALIITGLRLHGTILASLELRFANQNLIASLVAAKNAAERGAEELRQEVARRGRIEAALRRSQEQLLQSQKLEATGRLAGGIAHEFNNLLQVINGYCQILFRRLPPNDPSRDELEEIKHAGIRAATLTSQLLTFSRQQPIQPTVVDLNAAVGNLSEILRRLIGEDVELVTLFDPQAGPVRADRGQLDQILINLALNARDAMPSGGRLTIETARVEMDEAAAREQGLSRPGAYTMLVVCDTGTGMDEDTLVRIFEPFFTTKEPGKGTGLGLSTVYGMVQQNDGAVRVQSKLGRGTTFRIYLPQTDESAALAPGTAAAETARGAETVLLAEDEEGVRTFLKRTLEARGYTVLEARDGLEGLRLCQRHTGPIHLLLTDVVMPGMGGRELADRVMRLHPEAKVLFMSGYTEDTRIQHGVPPDLVAYLQKPFDQDMLWRRVRELLDGRS
jgi:signal transduction histidine kinase/ActR/RegA family two-component response regulator